MPGDGTARRRSSGAKRARGARTSALPALTVKQFLTAKDFSNYQQLTRNLHAAPKGAFVGLIGAGAKRDLNYPTWKALMEQLHLQADLASRRRGFAPVPASVRDLSDLPVRASIYRDAINDPKVYGKVIRSTFGERTLTKDAIAASIVRLPLRVILTTNYDTSLENAYRQFGGCSTDGDAHKDRKRVEVCDWTDERRVERLLKRLKAEPEWLEQARVFVHLHGVFDQPKSIVLTEQDYVMRYIKSQLSAKRLTAMLSFSRRLLCLGFSLDDIDLMEVFRQLHGLGGEVAMHTAILPSPEKRSEREAIEARRQHLQVKFGINAIFYKRIAGANPHANLRVLIGHLAEPEVAAAATEELAKQAAQVTNNLKARGNAGSTRRRRVNITELERDLKRAKDLEDPCKGRFGGLPIRDGFELTSRIYRSSDPYWFNIYLTVRSRDPRANPLRGHVRIYLHPSFPQPIQRSPVVSNRVTKKMWAWGAFTVGAFLEDHNVLLELDLANTDAPAAFRAR
jgi:hypothetical protein